MRHDYNKNNNELQQLPSITIFFISITTWSFVVYSLISTLGILANVLLLLAIYKDPLKCFHDATSIFIINMSLSDLVNPLCNGRTFTLEDIIWKYLWITIFCFSSQFLTYPSLFVLAFERSLAVICPLWHRVHIRRKVCYMVNYNLVVLCSVRWSECCVFRQRTNWNSKICFDVTNCFFRCVDSCIFLRLVYVNSKTTFSNKK